MPTKLDTARLFERLFEVYRAQFTLIVPAAILVFLPVAVLNGAIVAGGGGGLLLVGALLSLVATFWLQGMVIEAVRDMQDGRRDFSIGGLFGSVMPVLPKLIGIGVLTGIAIFIGLLLLVVPGLILMTWWAVVGPAVVIERRGTDAWGRSRGLVRGSGWQVFGVIVFVLGIQFMVNTLLRALLGGGDSFVGQSLASLISGALVGPISAIAAALMYLELRKLKEGSEPPAGGDLREPETSTAFGESRQPQAEEAFGASPESPSRPPSPNP